MSDFNEIKRQIKERALANLEELCKELFPNGKKRNNEWVVGNVQGDAGDSMGINLSLTDKRGLWIDRAFGQGGDIFDLYALNKGLNFIQAFDALCAKYGVSRVSSMAEKPKPKPYSMHGAQGMRGTKVMQYMHDRGLKEKVLMDYNIRSHTKGQVRKDKKTGICEPYFFKQEHFWIEQYIDSYGDKVMLKSIGIDKIAGKHDIWSTDPYYTLWGWWLVKPTHRECVIVEGGIDAMSLAQMLNADIPVLSVPNGAPNTNWIDNDYDSLNQFEKIYILFDEDKVDKRTGKKPGEEGAKQVSERLGRARCFRAHYPNGYKDANNVLIDGNEADKDVKKWLEAAKTYDPPSMRGVDELIEETIVERRSRMQALENAEFAWAVKFVQLDGKITLLQGYSGSGKSTACYQIALADLMRGHNVLYISLEIPANEMVEEMTTQWIGKSPTDHQYRMFKDKFAGRMYYVEDKDDSIKAQALLQDIEYAYRRFGVTRVFIDSLHFLVEKNDLQAQDDFVKSVKRLAEKLKRVHITLIAHSRYGDYGEHKIPRVDDIEGSKGMIKPAQNILAWWRNIPKEDALDDPSSVDEKTYSKLTSQPDAYLKCYKQRNGYRARFTQGMWFDFPSKRYRTDRFRKETAMEIKEDLEFDKKEEDAQVVEVVEEVTDDDMPF